jgi:hypothetical protein
MIKRVIDRETFLSIAKEIKAENYDAYWDEYVLSEKRLDHFVVSTYLKEAHVLPDPISFFFTVTESERYELLPVFRQSDFEAKAGNCAITAVTSVLRNSTQEGSHALYERVKKTAESRYFYSATRGLQSLFIPSLISSFDADIKATHSLFFKGRSLPTFKRADDFMEDMACHFAKQKLPCILSLGKKNKPYGEHAVLVVGTMKIRVYINRLNNVNPPDATLKLLAIHDGWGSSVNYLDVNRAGAFHFIKLDKD